MQPPFVFQIAAQELSDNRVITLSMAGRKLDKKVSGVVSGECAVKSLSFMGLKDLKKSLLLGIAVTENSPAGEDIRVRLEGFKSCGTTGCWVRPCLSFPVVAVLLSSSRLLRRKECTWRGISVLACLKDSRFTAPEELSGNVSRQRWQF